MKLDVKELIAKLTNTPMVVEQGTDGRWAYRKWSDGTAECWQWTASASIQTSRTYGNGYYKEHSDTFAFPSGLFTSAPTTEITVESNGGLMYFAVKTTNLSRVEGYYASVANETRTVYTHIYCIGKWK